MKHSLFVLAVVLVIILLFLMASGKLSFLSSSDNKPANDYLCPVGEYIDCMPGPSSPKPQCDSRYLSWAMANCPNFQGAAY